MKKQNIPNSVLICVVLLVLFLVLANVLFFPALSRIDQYNANHDAAVAEVAKYEYTLENQAKIDEKIAQLTEKYNEEQSLLYVDSKSSIEDLQRIFNQLKITMTSLSRGAGVQDPQGRTSTTGIPLYTTSLEFSFRESMEKTQKLIHYLEQDSKGCYFINSISMAPIDKTATYDVRLSVTLYYFDATKMPSAAVTAE
ncbi:MAG: hypothetical protein ACI4IS_03680 [Acutalibacteraceae bacterium]